MSNNTTINKHSELKKNPMSGKSTNYGSNMALTKDESGRNQQEDTFSVRIVNGYARMSSTGPASVHAGSEVS